MKRTMGWVVNIILVCLLAMVVGLFLLPRLAGWRVDAVLSGSMEPDLSVGGVVLIKPVEPVAVRVGDIIAYQAGEVLITHRVIELVAGDGEPSFVAKGDANEDPDISPVAAASVFGVVVFDMPYLGYLAAFVKTRLGFLLTVFLPGLAIIALELRKMWQVVLNKDEAAAEPEATPPQREERLAVAEHEASSAAETKRGPIDGNMRPKAGVFTVSSRADKLAVGATIGAAVTIAVILAGFLL